MTDQQSARAAYIRAVVHLTDRSVMRDHLVRMAEIERLRDECGGHVAIERVDDE